MPIVPALRHRNFRLFLTGQFISLTGTWMQTVAQGWLVLQLTDSALAVGAVTAAGGLPVLLFTLYGGVVADRVNKRRWVAFLQALMMLEAAALGVLTVTGHITAVWVGVLAAFAGLAAAFEIPARQALVAEIVGREDLPGAIALNSTVFNVTRVFGPVVSGLVLTGFGAAACFFANAASFLAAILALLSMAPLPFDGVPARQDEDRSLRRAIGYLKGKRRPRVLILLTAALTVFGFSYVTMLPVYAREAMGRGPTGYGGLVSATGVGASLAALAMAGAGWRIGRQRDRVVFGAATVFGLALILAGLVRSYWLAMMLFAFAGCAMITNNILTNTLLQTEVPNNLRGRLMGFYSLMVVGMAPVGALQAGWIAEHFGVRATLLIGGAVCLVAGVLAARPRTDVRPIAEAPAGAGRE
ncbi:MAG: MFS transporter [Gemmatimonadota bacterium]